MQYSYEIFHKINKSNRHLNKSQNLDFYKSGIISLNDLKTLTNVPKIIGHLSDNQIKQLDKGKQITHTIKEEQTIIIKPV